MLARLEARARTLGVRIELGSRVDRLPEPPVIVATSLDLARRLLGDDSLHWDSGRTLLLDLGLRRGGATPSSSPTWMRPGGPRITPSPTPP